MDKTNEVRSLLDERGVEHEDSDISVGEKAYGATTCWEFGDVVARFSEKADVGTLLEAWDVTPEQAIAATVGRPKVKKVRGMTYDEHGGEVYYLACSGCGEWIDGDLDCITEHDGPNFCHNCGGEFDGPLLCKRCGGLADLEYGDMCAECYEEVGA